MLKAAERLVKKWCKEVISIFKEEEIVALKAFSSVGKIFFFFFSDFGETLLLDCGALQLASEQRHASRLTLGHILNPPIDSK